MQTINLKAAIAAGFAAGLAFIVLEMVLVATLGGGSAWAPPRMIAAILLGEGVLPPPATFDVFVVAVAFCIHFLLAIGLSVLFAWAVEKARLGGGATVTAGVVFGLAVYVFNFYVMTAAFPWFAMARNAISIFAHAVFGLILAYVYRALAPLRIRA